MSEVTRGTHESLNVQTGDPHTQILSVTAGDQVK
jgi:hypothetical protein